MIYLDHAATEVMPTSVADSIRGALVENFANASALHTPGHRAFNAVEECRAKLARMIGCDADEIIFTSGASESNNTVMHIFEGFEIIASPLEHHSVLEAAHVWGGKDTARRLLSFMLANNETGEILDLPSKEDNTYLHSDLTQVLGKLPIDVYALGLDYATFSAHKIGGPIGVGALYVRKGAPFKPLIVGGRQENGRRGGTYNVPGLVGFAAALDYVVAQNSIERYATHVRYLRDTLAKRILTEIPGSALNTDITEGKSLPNILNVSFAAAEGESIQLYLDAEGVIVSTGSACAAGDIKPSHVLMAKTGDAEVAHSSIRFSFGLDNTMSDVDVVMKVLPGIIARLQGMSTIKRDLPEEAETGTLH